MDEPTEQSQAFELDDRIEKVKALNDFYDSVTFPPLLARVKALLADLLVILLIFSLTSVVISEFGNTPDWVRGFIFILCVYLYEPILISSLGGTLGHKIVGIQVKRVHNPKQRLNLLMASIRFITKYLLGWISFLTITANPKKRAIHDLSSGSIVLYIK